MSHWLLRALSVERACRCMHANACRAVLVICGILWYDCAESSSCDKVAICELVDGSLGWSSLFWVLFALVAVCIACACVA